MSFGMAKSNFVVANKQVLLFFCSEYVFDSFRFNMLHYFLFFFYFYEGEISVYTFAGTQ